MGERRLRKLQVDLLVEGARLEVRVNDGGRHMIANVGAVIDGEPAPAQSAIINAGAAIWVLDRPATAILVTAAALDGRVAEACWAASG